ncbi:MAG: type 2 lanthipeptide synthetase LanM family protein, partial [Candidatus Binatia bacterium]
MEAFYERLIARAATIDELLSDGLEPGPTGDPDLAAARIAAWCRSSANGEPKQFRRRLERDGLSYDDVMTRFASVRRGDPATRPAWIDDAVWIESALRDGGFGQTSAARPTEPHAFEHLLLPVAERAETLLWSAVGAPIRIHFTERARADLSRMLLDQLTDLCAPPLYEGFAAT